MPRFDDFRSSFSSSTISSISSSQFSSNQSYFSDETTQNSKTVIKNNNSTRLSSSSSSFLESNIDKNSLRSESLYETGSETIIVESEVLTKFDNSKCASKFELPKSIVDSTTKATEFEARSKLDSDTSLLESTSIYSASSYKNSLPEHPKILYDDRKNYWKCRTWIIKTSTLCVRVQLPVAGKAFRVRFRNK